VNVTEKIHLGSVQTCLEVHAGWNAQTWRFYNLQEPRILCHIPKCQLDQSSIKHGHKSTSAIPRVLKDSCLPHHKHGTLTLEEAGRCLHMLLAQKYITSTFYMITSHGQHIVNTRRIVKSRIHFSSTTMTTTTTTTTNRH
jgi:hypothetical protein